MFLNNTISTMFIFAKTAKEIWDTLKLIYGDSSSIKQEKMNTRGKKI